MLWVVKQDEKQHLIDMCAEQQKAENAFFCLFHVSFFFFFLKKRSKQENILIVRCSKSIEVSPPPP